MNKEFTNFIYYPAIFRTRLSSNVSLKVSLFIQRLLLRLAVLLAALLLGHLVGLGWSRVGVERGELGVLTLLLNGLDGELLLALVDMLV